MQPELPWNVAGIPPEAREAARAAARREGLSVGEWMTRRILRGFPDAEEENGRSAWRSPIVEQAPARTAEPPPLPSARETEEMLARVSRSESESQNAYKAIDQQLRAVARRLETAEHNQTENNRAMTQAATQINIAAREQAQAFEQMSGNVTALAERLARVERQSQTDGMKEAIKALHQGLSRVADQIAQTANQSASQIASLAGNVDSLASQVAEAHAKADAAIGAGTQGLEQHLAALDERIRVVERTAYSSASALDHTMENVERLKAEKDSAEAELRQHSAAMAQMKEVFDHLGARISASESENAGAIGRIEEAVSRLQSATSQQDAVAPLDRRLSSIEHVLSDIMNRMEHTEQTSANANGGLEQSLRDLASGLEASDRHNRASIHELQNAVQDTASKLAAMENMLAASQAEAAAAAAAAKAAEPRPPVFDTPSFAEHAPPMHDGAYDFAPPPPFASEAPDFAHDDMPPPPPFGDQFESSPSGEHAGEESFLAAARRQARSAAAEADQAAPPRASMGGFAWTLPKNDSGKAGQQRVKRFALAGSILGVAVAAAMAGVVLTRGVSSPQPATPTTVSSPFAARPSLAPAKPETDDTAAQPATTTADDDTTAPAPVTSAPVAAPVPTVPRTVPTRLSATPRQAAAAPATAPAATQAAAPNSPLQKLASLANTGDAKSQLLLGLKYLDGNGAPVNEAEAARWLARAAQQGEPLAQYRLGTLYERGRGVAADPKLATHWYELAARQGNRKAMHNLAVAYAEGAGEAKDPAQAAVWFSKAANLGLADSQFNLAVLYERGMGVKQSLVDAYKWYLIAAAQGDAESKSRADALSTQLSDSDRAAAQAAATSFKAQAPNPAANSAPVLG
jgi:localization factor PodJL